MSTAPQPVPVQVKESTAYEAHIHEFGRKFHPSDCHEYFLVQTMADAAWRLRIFKAWELQIVAMCENTNPYLDPDLFEKVNRAHRHIQSIERSYLRALKELNAGRKTQMPEQTQSPAETPKRTSTPQVFRQPTEQLTVEKPAILAIQDPMVSVRENK
jgi:hypothetical protein